METSPQKFVDVLIVCSVMSCCLQKLGTLQTVTLFPKKPFGTTTMAMNNPEWTARLPGAERSLLILAYGLQSTTESSKSRLNKQISQIIGRTEDDFSEPRRTHDIYMVGHSHARRYGKRPTGFWATWVGLVFGGITA